MQFWPTTDTFDDHSSTGGPDHYGTSPDRYIAIEPWSTSPEPTTGYDLLVGIGTPFDGYQQLLGTGAGGCAMALEASPNDDAAAWTVERSVVSADVEVFADYSIRSTGGTFDSTSFRQFGVCACVGKGTFSGGATTDEVWSDVDGYFLIETKETATNHRVLLLEVSSGSITVLGSEDVVDRDPDHQAAPTGFFTPRPLRLTVEPDGGGGANLNAYRTRFAGQEVQLFGGQINRVTALDPGRCGFGVQTRFTSATSSSPIGLVEFFRVRTADGSSLLFSDEFRRWNRLAGRSIVDAFTSGRSLASAFSGDSESLQGAGNPLSLGRVLRRKTSGAPNDLLEVGDPANTDALGFPGYHVSQHPAETEVQRVIGEFTRLNSETSIACEMGVCVRFTCATFQGGFVDLRGRRFPYGASDRADNFKVGYVVTVLYESGPTWTLEVRHHDGNTLASYEAPVLATADLSAFSLSLGSAFTVDVEVQDYDGTNIGQGSFVALFIKVGGSTVTPVANTSITGIEVVDDFLVDRRTGATNQVGSNGFVIIPGGVSTGNLVEVNSFQRATPEADVEIDIRDQATVPVIPEDDGASGSLTVPLGASFSRRFVDEAIVHPMESGAKNVLLASPVDRSVYDFEALLDDGEWQLVEGLYESNGASVPFDLTRADTGETIRGLFVEDTLVEVDRHVENGRVVKRIAFQFEQVFGADIFNPEA